ncbi:MAG: acyl-CoA thioesterase [Pseudomonadales bacterium]
MEHYKIVLPEALNDYGSLFGGALLKWIDEIAYIRVSLDFPGQHFVTIGLDNVEFRHRIQKGQILRFLCEKTRVGNTSVTYNVRVYAARYGVESNTILFESNITFVCVDGSGSKKPIANAGGQPKESRTPE